MLFFAFCDVCLLQPCCHLLGEPGPLATFLCDVFICFSQFPICCPGSGVVLDCIDF